MYDNNILYLLALFPSPSTSSTRISIAATFDLRSHQETVVLRAIDSFTVSSKGREIMLCVPIKN